MTDLQFDQHTTQRPIISLLGKRLYPFRPTDEASLKLLRKTRVLVDESLASIDQEPDEPSHYMKAGMYTWLCGDIHQAIEMFDRGTERCCKSYELYWYKTLAKTTVRDIAGAVEDGEKAVALIANVPDHGLDHRVVSHPDPKHHFASSNHYMIWYHLGMAYYLNCDLENAKRAYLACRAFIYSNESRVSHSCWFYPVLRELGEYDLAASLVSDIEDDIRVLSDRPYREMCLLFKGTLSVQDIQALVDENGHLHILHDYAIAYWYYTHGDHAIAAKLFERVCARPETEVYVQIAAEVKLKELLGAGG